MIELSHDELVDLLQILGGAIPLYRDLADKPDTPGIFKELFTDYADRAEDLSKKIAERANEYIERVTKR